MSNNLFFGYMISSKLNFIVSAAILASTVYILWIKIKRKSSSHHKIESDSEICKKNQSEEVTELQSESFENFVDSKFNTQEENEGELGSILETKCSFNIGELEVRNLNDQETLNPKNIPLTNVNVNVSSVEIMDLNNANLEISNNKQEISTFTTEIINSVDDLMEEKIYNYNEFSTVVKNENEINLSLEDGEIIDDSINETEIENMENILINKISEISIKNNESTLTEIEDGEIVDESLVENQFVDLISDNSENIIKENNNLTEFNRTPAKDLEQTFENSNCNELHVERQIPMKSIKEIEEGEIVEESFVENDSISQKDEEIEKCSEELIELPVIKDPVYDNNENEDSISQKGEEIEKCSEELIEEPVIKDPVYDNNENEDSISQKGEENQEKFGDIETYSKSSVENLDIINIVDKEIEVLVDEVVETVNKCSEDTIENDQFCTTEILANYESSIENNDSTEKMEEFTEKKEEIHDELIPIENRNQIKEEFDRFCSTETSIEKESLIANIIDDDDDTKNEEISNNNNLIGEMKDEYLGNEVEYSKIENTETSTNNIDLSTSDLSQNSDYLDDGPLDKFMDYIDECLNGNESKIDENCKLENWPNDEDSLNNIKRDFYENSTAICSPHPSSESDHAHCVNNLTERVAILSAESILDNQCQLMNSSDSEMTPTLSSPTLDDSNPELYVEKITYDGKELDVVYFEEALLEEGGIQSDIKIIRTIPVGLGGRIIGKKGKTKNELLKKYGAQLLIYNHPNEIGKQILEITCNPSVSNQLENWVSKTLEQITKNTIQTTVSNPEWLKPMIPLGRLVAAHIVDMSTVQYVKIRIFDQRLIKAFNQMQNEMNIDYSRADNTSLLPRPVAAGCVCVAMIRPDYFLRAQIVDIYEDFAWVYLFDLGKVCQTYLCYLFKIREKYMRVPFQVIPARMPHALIKNKNISPAIIYKRFLCDPVTNKPRMVRVFFPRMNTCCEPCVNIYIPMSTVSADSSSSSSSNEEFVDLLELLVSIDVCSMVRETVNSDMQVKINTNHFRAFLNGKDKKPNPANSNVPVYFQPCNSKFYDDFIEFKSENETVN